MAKRLGVHVLMVEEDQFFGQIYRDYFEAEGWKVSIQTHGDDAYDDIKKKRPSVVLLDLLLTHGDGFAILERIKADSSLRNIPIIILTSLGQKSDIEKAFSLGATEYLIKTQYPPQETIKKIHTYLTPKRR